tara:strand:- start:550 stop:2202 length:1653 start_codon:yes stop_codon:yes gene_type:complete
MIDKIIKRMGSQAGMALTASTLFIFVLLSIMAFYLARFSILSSESAGYYLQNIRARNLVQTGLEIGLQTISTSYSSLQSSITGKLNKGTYTVSVDNSKDEVNSNLAYNHYSLLKSTTVVGGVHRAGRLIISPYPNAFNLSLFSDNQSNGTFNANSNSSITGDFFFNGTISNVTMGNNSVAYSSSSSSSSPIIFHGLPKPSFPVLNHSIYTNILATVSGQYNPSSGGGQTGSATATVWNPSGGHCNVCPNDANSNNRYACSSGYGGWSNSHSFNDFIPTGSVANRIKIRFKGATPCGGTWNISPSVNGQIVNNDSWSGSGCSCNSCSTKDVVSASHTNGFPGYKYGSSNSLTFSHSGTQTCIGYVQVIIDYSASSVAGVAENKSINLSSLTNNTLMHDGNLTLTSCNISGSGYILASGNITISGSTTIGGGVKIISNKTLTINGSSSIGSSISNYCVLYGKEGVSIQGSTFYGLIISLGNSLSLTSSTLNGAILTESSGNTLSSATINGSIVSKNNLSLTSSNIVKSNLPDLFGLNLGFKPSVIPGSYLEY